MVRYGFNLAELRQLYIDEFYSYFLELTIILEKEGVLKEGTADKVQGVSDVDQLKSQLRKLRTKKI